jgi:hypothetical protein
MSPGRRAPAAVLALALLGCSGPAGGPAAAPPPATPVPGGASPSGGTTPQVERVRFAGRIRWPLPERARRELRGTTWHPGCPVPLRDLALLRFNYVGFDGQVHRGPMVVHRSVASDVLGVFHELFAARFPLKRVALAERFRPTANPNSRRDVTAAFNCRPVITPAGPQPTLSQHAWGLAVDVNPLQNPYIGPDGSVRNRYARPYVDRSQDLPGMIHEGDVVVCAFAAIGWSWGGRWSGAKDTMHFSLTGR